MVDRLGVGLPGKMKELNLNVGYGTNSFLVYVCPRCFKRHTHAKVLLVVYLKKISCILFC